MLKKIIQKNLVVMNRKTNVNKSLKGLILKVLPEHLEYAFLQPEKGKPIIISAELTKLEKQKLLEILRKY